MLYRLKAILQQPCNGDYAQLEEIYAQTKQRSCGVQLLLSFPAMSLNATSSLTEIIA